MPIKAVVFDIGNVLIEWQPEQYYDRVYGADRRKALFDAVDLHGMNELIDQGQPFKEVIYDWAEQHPQFATEIRDWHDAWITLAAPPIWHSVRILRSLRLRLMPVFALSNFGVENFELAQSHYDFLNEFDQEFISGRLKVTKPSADIYARVETACGIAPEDLLFTDDRAENIKAAQELGWQTHLFDGPEGWAERLVSEGILSSEEAA